MKAFKVFSPGAWQTTEVGVALSAAGRGLDQRAESGSQSPTGGEAEMGLAQEKRKITDIPEK